MSLSKQSQDFNIKLDRRQSMDRLNDDCVGLVLSYLSLQDKFRLECVSKQWKRKMFLYVDRIKIVFNNFEPIKIGIGSYKREYIHSLDCSQMMTIPYEKSHEVNSFIFYKLNEFVFVNFLSLQRSYLSCLP